MDAGPAAFLKPVVEGWLESPPPFDWSIRLGEKASPVFSNMSGLKPHRGADVARAEAITARIGDALLVSAGGWPVEKAHVQAGQKKGIPAIQYVDSCYNYANRLCAEGDWTLPDMLLLITERSIAEAQAEGVPAGICRAVGHPHWGSVTRLPAPETGDVLFIGAPVERDYGHSLGYTESDSWRMLVDVLSNGFDGVLHYAPHPEQASASLPADADIVPYDTAALSRYGTFVGMFSAPLVDAFLAGRRSISLQPDATATDMFFLTRQGFMPRVTDRDELVGALAAPPSKRSSFAGVVHGSTERLNAVLREALTA